MKTTAALFALSLLLLSGAANAHHGASHEMQAFKSYGVSWMGVMPKSGAAMGPASTPDFWKKAFVSKYRITGSAPFLSGF